MRDWGMNGGIMLYNAADSIAVGTIVGKVPRIICEFAQTGNTTIRVTECLDRSERA